MTEEQILDRLETLNSSRIHYQRAIASADTDESAAYFRRQIAKIDDEKALLSEKLNALEA